MNDQNPRRALIKAMLYGAAAIPASALWQSAVAAAPEPMLDTSDPTAKALGYVPDVSKLDAKANPTYAAGQHCGVCAQFKGQPTDKKGGCNLFPGKQVYVNGWCRGWTKKPS